MVQQKGESWGFTGNSNFCPSKPMQWVQRAEAFPYTQKGRLTLVDGGDFNKNMFLLSSPPLSFLSFL
eukprot:4403743-Ditylum_brightwellii.AAC.1